MKGFYNLLCQIAIGCLNRVVFKTEKSCLRLGFSNINTLFNDIKKGSLF